MIAFVCFSIKQERIDQGIETEGSNLSGVSAKCVWDDLSRPPEDEEDSRSICIGSQPRRLSDKGMASLYGQLSQNKDLRFKNTQETIKMEYLLFLLSLSLSDTEQIRETLRKGLEFNSKAALPPINSQKMSHERTQWVLNEYTHTRARIHIHKMCSNLHNGFTRTTPQYAEPYASKKLSHFTLLVSAERQHWRQNENRNISAANRLSLSHFHLSSLVKCPWNIAGAMQNF